VAIGVAALLYNTTGVNNTATGTNALKDNTTGINNTATGHSALGLNTTGAYNTATGVNALRSNTTGTYNVATGFCALGSNQIGGSNVAVGANALQIATSGSTNTALGSGSLASLTTGSNNAGLGINSGNDPMCLITNQNNNVVIGNNSTTWIGGKVAFTNLSDVRVKKIDESGVGLALPFVQALTPIKYQFCDPETGEVTDDTYRYGFSAQEIMEHEENPEHPIIVRTNNPDRLFLNETQMLPVLVNAIKEIASNLDAVVASNEALAAENADLKARVEVLEGGASA
jgi:hypothetical protein